MKFDTALREYIRQKILEIGPCDIIVGIPTYNNEETVTQVMKTVYEGLWRHYPDKKAVVFISDGGSLDYTRELAQKTKSDKGIPKIVAIYRGLPGKGTSLRAVFEAAVRLNVQACVVFDADLRSITPEWVKALIDPILREGYDFVSPFYVRHKYDATITNNIAYSLTRALYGKRVRQPIGGDFGFSRRLIEFFNKEYVWETDVAKFGVDIWMTTLALNEGFKVCEAYLGTKVHDPKDPSASLGPMFRQVVGTLFGMMSKYEHIWRRVRGSVPVPLLGTPFAAEPPPIEVDLLRLINNFQVGLNHFGSLWREIVHPDTFSALTKMSEQTQDGFYMPAEVWVHTIYDFAYTYSRWAKDRYKLVELMTPLYYGRVASFILETKDMTTQEADEKVVERQAELFENEKRYLLERMGLWEAVELS
ncbi:MAG: glycosyltransferase family 2 protein [Candidatus Brocadiales bacterium]|nr:glycosyltransferase family 2 protein [Candidatus Brocadiales bacterium]